MPVKEIEKLEYKYIKDKLNPLIEFFINKTKKEYTPKCKEAKTVFTLFLLVSKNMYFSIIHLCAEKPDDYTRNEAFILSTIPLIRVLLEIVFAVAFISEDIENRIEWYYKAGWREMKEMYERYKKKYFKDKTHSEWLDDFDKYLQKTKDKYFISASEENNLKNINTWPIPSKMRKNISIPLSVYFQYLDDWFYKEFSQAAHLSLPGLSKMGAIFLKDNCEERDKYYITKRTEYYISSVIMVLSILSEFENIMHLGKTEDLKYLWTLVGSYSEDCKDIYNERYNALLST